MLRKLESFGVVPSFLQKDVLRQNVNTLESITTKLPDNYKDFLLHFGASILFNVTVVFRARQASPWADTKGFDSLESLYGLCKGSNEYTVFEALDTYWEDLHGQWLPIGASAGDNQICICLKGALFGQVWCWDHEVDPVFNYAEVVSGMTKVANTFEEFIGLLESRYEKVDMSGVVKVDLDF
ncbi:SMI1/KNR4 family protein [Cronobacter dublinensis]|uniref:SMI1/KNR4 family protein n=1 Tax=Cronobacter dublinensis TaxID=413497 RepID=UPI0023DC857B|nr:SMI1/KNR4 family protein [Cronobacter dublinensis]ELY4377317.1 SMI1/KNR4 family protein [Cronobacter sakazakii]ELY2798225.1 SMI1/KNR4 family protein [Cronobacter dublinensis]ELY3973174.1 SMI1/KNR4 family protein [Cronobacter dublinensis]ELY4487687.1 SMI1/KNR4 family protein [Cronobacter dublinensis]ELY5825987.1 SMI1/KNR4 family protein [Cronobacter dublinensis]